MNNSKKSILDINNGMVLKLADYEMQKILQNIADPNTDPKKKRKITIELGFTPNEDRSEIKVEIKTKSTLTPNKPAQTTLFNIPNIDSEGIVRGATLKEVSTIAHGQANLFDGSIHQPEILELEFSNKK